MTHPLPPCHGLLRPSRRARPVGLALAMGLAISLAMAALLPLAGCANKSAETALTINKTLKVTRGEYDAVYNEFVKRLNLEAAGAKEKDEALKNRLLQEQLKQMTFNKLIFTSLLAQDAQAMAITVSDADIKDFKDKNLAQMGGPQALEKVLKAEGMTLQDFDKNLRDEILIKKFVEARAQRDHQPLAVSDADIQAFYNSNKAMFNQPEAVKASHILFKAMAGMIRRDILQKNPKATEDEILREIKRLQADKKKAAAQTLAEVLKTPARFETLAREKSDDTATGLFGGNLNMLTAQSADPGFWRAALAGAKTLGPSHPQGKILPQVVESMFGYHVVRVTGYRPAGQAPLAQVREELREQLGMQKRQAVLMAWMNAKRKGIQLEFAPDLKPEGFEQTPADGSTPQAAASSQARQAADAMGAQAPPAPAASGG